MKNEIDARLLNETRKALEGSLKFLASKRITHSALSAAASRAQDAANVLIGLAAVERFKEPPKPPFWCDCGETKYHTHT